MYKKENVMQTHVILVLCTCLCALTETIMFNFRIMMQMVYSGAFLVAVTHSVASHHAALPAAAWVN